MIKKMLLALAGYSLCSVAFAGHPGDDVVIPLTVPVTIPQQTGSWIVGIEALYLESNNHDLNYAITSLNQSFINGSAIGSTFPFHTYGHEPDHEWGIRGDVAYLFAGNGRDVRFAWTRFHESDSDHYENIEGVTLQAVADDIAIPADIFSTSIFTWDTAKGDFHDIYDAIDLVFGQEMEFGQRVNLHAFGGLRYADINTRVRGKFHAPYEIGDPGDEIGVDALFSLRSDFEGMGPRVGMDTEIHLGGNFNLVGIFAGSLLVGDFDQRYSAFAVLENATENTVDVAEFRRQLPSKTTVIPELDARVGLKYTHPFSPSAAMGVELGYESTNYFNVVDNSLVSYTDSMAHQNYHADQGLYLRLEFSLV